jgi:hypothetical protein
MNDLEELKTTDFQKSMLVTEESDTTEDDVAELLDADEGEPSYQDVSAATYE